MVRVLLVGATGSIGRSTLDVLRSLGPRARLHGVFCRSRVTEMIPIAREFGVRFAGAAALEAHASLKDALPDVSTGTGSSFLEEAIADPETDVVVNAATGAAGLPASLATVRHGKTLALANKESLVVAGPLLLEEARRSGAAILPVDSEHSALHQCLRSGKAGEARRIILTASGGPFRTWSKEQIAHVTPAQALRHPTWEMGPKITVDSATMMNKALELIEARWLFDVDAERIDVVVHPQSIVHSLVEFQDGSVLAQMGVPDMRLPIRYALTYPDRMPSSSPGFGVAEFATLTFEPPDPDRFPALRLGDVAARRGGTAGAILNAANEVAVQRFLDGEISFPAIAETAEAVLEEAEVMTDPTLADIEAADRAAREEAARCRI